MSTYEPGSGSSSPSAHARRRTTSITSAVTPPLNHTYNSSTILSCLPKDYQSCFFEGIQKLRRTSQRVLNEVNETGNQYLVVYHLPQDIMEQIDSREISLGVSFRFMFCTRDRLGIMKIIPSGEHDQSTEKLKDTMMIDLLAMGVNFHAMTWSVSTTYQGGYCGKQPDQQLIPTSQIPPRPLRVSPVSPTLVIETGVSESLAKLRWDAGWWLTNTNGGVKIALVVSINRNLRKVQLEKWEMVGQTTRTRQSIAPQAVQTIYITQNNAHGAPLVLGFADLMSRQPTAQERDVVIPAVDLIRCFDTVW
ncbi:hypothetical protein N7474_003938 [Penicillium riverlandense]|uniref:uncharacterized protein n=1 Tax=Penicillium riverlandense TaxID=1903569 RepID=UPI0025476EC3|nr:uncharacterized protein N7474_003938 [Penicillium riverlandense]KAJ5818347.1 hypothetical protein N7474_003938 [Penicillium riverlandense]